MKFSLNAKIFRGQLDVAPFASVFFLLAIFMIFSSLLISSPSVKIQLPAIEGNEIVRANLPKLDIAVDADGRIYFESQLVALDALHRRLEIAVARFRKKPSLVLHADKDADLEKVLQICQTAVTVGITETIWTARQAPFKTAEPSPLETK
ncbi:MAG: hypothetical protein M2R45_02327 [Verrucomicrobia subdivision 3 bacterium]|nr:hypothetical protein [Limisphaerales bacterium]MCS1414706.1 hypothetical protein [Limisphaerales bacterium]